MNTNSTPRPIRLMLLGMLVSFLSWQASPGQIIKILYPSITSNPVDVEFCETSTASYAAFSVSASYTTSYQWQYYSCTFVNIGGKWVYQCLWKNFVDGTYVYGSTGTKLYLYKPSGGWSSSANRTIRVVCSNTYGQATSNTAYLKVHNLPTITTPPASATVWIGDSHTLSVGASSTYTPTYQWQKWLRDKLSGIYTWVNLTGETSSSYTTTSSGSYRVRVSDAYCGSVYSDAATITRVGITSSPSNVSECSSYNSSISFTVYASNATAYQWQENKGSWVNISGATSQTYTKAKPASGWSASDNAQYRCLVSFSIGSAYSGTATLTITEPPVITNHPGNTTKNEGESVTFSIIANGATTYQWQKYVITDWENISGATGSSYSIASVVPADAGNYRCITGNSCGQTTSNPATLSVNPDIGEDGWFAQNSGSSKTLGDASFVNANDGWVITDETDLLLHTLTGGETWTDVYMEDVGGNPIYSYSQSVDFTSSNNGFVTGYNGYAYTTNGGSTWTKKDLRTELGISNTNYFYTRNMFFLTSSHGWIVGDDGLIAVTTNGGSNWAKVAYAKDASKLTDASLYEVFFTDLDTGYLAGASGKIYRTVNGGATKNDWVDVSSPRSNTIRDMHFVTGRKGFAVDGEYRKILKTVNGGDTWTDITLNINNSVYLYAVEFADANNGWVSGLIYENLTGSTEAYGVVFRTNDGGNSWRRQKMETGIDKYIQGLAVVDADNAWAVGSSGSIQRTATGGCMIPTMNLGADQAICEGQTVTLVADTFEQNLNCSYVWQDASDGGTFIASVAGTYSVTATSLCGVTASDDMVLSVNALPATDAGVDVAICFGDTIQLNASGGVSYTWSVNKGSGYISDPAIANPMVTAAIGKTTFTVTATNAENCSLADNLILTVYQVPNAVVDAPATVCRNADTDIYYTGNASASADFYWDFDEGTDTPLNSTHYSVAWNTVGTQTITLAVSENGCYSDTARVQINISPIPISEFSMPEAICDSGYANIVYSGIDSLNADYSWDFDNGKVITGADEGPYQISWTTEGTKTVSLQVNQEGCESFLTQYQIVVSYPYNEQELCLVTLDEETGKNAIIWEKGNHPGVEFYKIYRESVSGGVYTEIATMPADTLSYYVDMDSDPESGAYKYKIAVIDTCGNISDESLYHKTMHLTTNLGSDQKSINLIWTEYMIEPSAFGFETYIIRRGPSAGQLDSLTSQPSDRTTYTDKNPLAGDNFYQVVGVLPESCSPTGNFKAGTGPYQHSLSNLDDNKLKGTSVQDALANAQNLKVYPNPFQDQVRVEYKLAMSSDVKIEVFNILGVRLLEVENERQAPGSYHYDISADDLAGSSVFYLRFSVDDKTSVTKLVPAR